MPLRFHVQPYRYAARLALIAMLLLVTGPVIGQLSAFGESGHHQPDVSMPTMAHAASPAQHHPLSNVIGWHEQCGYCSLYQHFPVLAGILPPVAHMPLLAAAVQAADTHSAYGRLTVFPHALTRAPPASAWCIAIITAIVGA